MSWRRASMAATAEIEEHIAHMAAGIADIRRHIAAATAGIAGTGASA